MTDDQKAEIKRLIAWYDAEGVDWSSALEFTVRLYNGSLPNQERPGIPPVYRRRGRQMKERDERSAM